MRLQNHRHRSDDGSGVHHEVADRLAGRQTRHDRSAQVSEVQVVTFSSDT